MTSPVHQMMESIDWPLLRKQKEWLLGAIEESTGRFARQEALEGILYLIDHLQEAAVAEGYATEASVFGET